ncbi:hypothetical protein SLEP1_g52892 [Rubroshorea leprosula]|uniref:DUF382 domain-containing protein n=1 Tax=Rubroshorea leprosula TaxID=152421 RepID=A0AAV5M7Q1_9ROSI|nr:hypothetical protein SLEP1_g52892 [Rubroshorea leprosula]
MTVEVVPHQNGVVLANGDLSNGNSNPGVAAKKSRESERRRRRRKQKKINKASQAQAELANGTDGGDSDAGDDDAKENANPQQVMEPVVVEYVPEKAELDDGMDEEFRKVFEKFSFQESVPEDEEKKEESALDAEPKKKADSDSEEEEQDNQQKEKGGVSNKKKKLQRRMKIAELKQICSRPDVVEVWDATAADPKLLVFLKAYRNTVPVPRHWCQKRKYLQVCDPCC